MSYEMILLALWGFLHFVVFGSCLVSLLAYFDTMNLYSKLLFLCVLIGAATRVYGFGSGVKFQPNFWDVLFMVGVAGGCIRVAVTGVTEAERLAKSAAHPMATKRREKNGETA